MREGLGAIASQFDITRNIFLKVGYFDLGIGERNLVSFLKRQWRSHGGGGGRGESGD